MKYITNIYWYLFFSFVISASFTFFEVYSDYKEYKKNFDTELQKIFYGANQLASGNFKPMEGYFISKEGFQNENELTQGNSYNSSVWEKDDLGALFVVTSGDFFEIQKLRKKPEGIYTIEYTTSTYLGLLNKSAFLSRYPICHFDCQNQYFIEAVNGYSKPTPREVTKTYKKAYDHFMQESLLFDGEHTVLKKHKLLTDIANRYFRIDYVHPLTYSKDKWKYINNFAKKYEIDDWIVYCCEGRIEYQEVTDLQNIKDDSIHTFVKSFAFLISIYVLGALFRYSTRTEPF